MSAGRLFVEVTGAAVPAPGCVGLSISAIVIATRLLQAAKEMSSLFSCSSIKYGFICTQIQIFNLLNKKGHKERKKEKKEKKKQS